MYQQNYDLYDQRTWTAQKSIVIVERFGNINSSLLKYNRFRLLLLLQKLDGWYILH